MEPIGRLAGEPGIPIPVTTQWEIVAEAAAAIQPAMEELIRQAAQGEVLHNDDTSMPVLALRRKADTSQEASAAAERTGVFTSGIVATAPGHSIALFFTGRQHAGENLADVLKRRAAELAPPIQVCDALSRNLPKLPQKLEVIVGHCLAHARRRFVEVTPNFFRRSASMFWNNWVRSMATMRGRGNRTWRQRAIALPSVAQRSRHGPTACLA